MKKFFRVLPPLQWCSLLFAALTAAFQVLAMLLCYEEKINHFAQGAFLPTLAMICFGLSLITGIISAIITPASKLSTTIFASKRTVPIPAFGFALLTDILLFRLISLAIDLWEISPTGEIFFKNLFTGNTKIAVLCIPLLIIAVVYCFLISLPGQRTKKNRNTLLGFGTVLACMLLTIYLYFDMTILMTSPVKTFLQAGLLCSMIFFTGELRYLLERPLPRLFSVCTTLVLATGAISVPSGIIAFLSQKLPSSDYFACALLLLSMIPHALIYLIRLHSNSSDISNQQEPISSQQADSERNSL